MAIYFYAFVWLISFSRNEQIQNLKTFKIQILLFVGYFLFHVFGLLYTENMSDGLKFLEKSIGFIVLPILILTGRRLAKNECKAVFGSFILSCSLLAGINLVHAGYRYVYSGNPEEFFYDTLSQTFDSHPIYISIYYLFCIILLLAGYADHGRGKYRLIYFLAIFYFGIIIILLESKMVYTISVILLSVVAFRLLYLRTESIAVTGFVIIALIVGSVSFAVKTSQRFKEIASFESLTILKEDRMTDFLKVNGLTLRVMFWKFSLEEFLSKNSLLLGLGTGDVQDFLDRTYEKHNMAITLDGKSTGYYGYDVHNQFLDIFLRLGLFGLCYFLFFIGYLLRFFYLRRNFVALSLFGSIGLLFFTETFLGLNKGIIFFAFFCSLFLLQEGNHSYRENSHSGDQRDPEQLRRV